MEKRKTIQSMLLLLLTALIWGAAFVAQKDGMAYVRPFTFICIRNFIGAAFLLLVLPLLDRIRSGSGAPAAGTLRDLVTGGILCGLAMAAASLLQQYGILLQDPETNVGKAGFITACYMVFVPVLGLFLRKRSPLLVWIGVAVALAGFFCLSLMDGVLAGLGLGLGLSDLLLLLCAVAFAVHILIIDRFSPLTDGVRMSCIQFFVCGLVCLPGMLWERPDLSDLLSAWLPILYAGIMSSGVAYTLQIVGQKNVPPAIASLLLSMESVFSVLAGYVLTPGSSLSRWELFGCVLVFAAVLLVQFAPRNASEAPSA